MDRPILRPHCRARCSPGQRRAVSRRPRLV